MAESAFMLSSASSFASQPLLSSFLLSFSSAQHISFPAASLAPLADLCIRSGLSLSTAATVLATDAPITGGSKNLIPADADPSYLAPPWTLAVAASPCLSTSLPPDGNTSGAYVTAGRRLPPLFTSPAYRLLDPMFHCTAATQADGRGRHASCFPHPAQLTQCSPHILGHDALYGPSPLYAHPSTAEKYVAGSAYYRSTLYSSYAFISNPVSFVTSVSATVQDAVAPPPSKTDTWHVTVPHTFRARSIGRKRIGGSGGSGSDGWDGGMDGAGFSGGDPWSFDGSDFPVGGGGDGLGGGWGNSGGGGGSWNGGGGGSSGGDPGAGGAGGEGGGGEDDPWWREWEQGGSGWRDADWWWLLQLERPTVPPVANPSNVWSLVHMWAWEFSRNWRAGAWGVQRGASLLYRIACWLSLSRCFCHALGTALAASASAPPALRCAAACIMVTNPQAAPAPAPPAMAAAQKGLASAVPAAMEGAWRGSLAQCCCFSGSLILALNAAGARWGPEGQGDVREIE
ncbi:unnamed protein product [Closterium sp. NIES-53]